MNDDSDFVFNLFRTFENFEVIHDNVGLFVEIEPIKSESTKFYVVASLQHLLFKIKLGLNFFKYMFNFKIQKDWKSEGRDYFKEKLQRSLFKTRVYMVVQSTSQESAKAKLDSLFNNFNMFKNYPLNQFKMKVKTYEDLSLASIAVKTKQYPMTRDEISSFFHFPQSPGNETSLLTVKAKKLTLPIGVPTYDYTINEKHEVLPKEHPNDVTIM